jgi:hypothetical protein
MLKPPCAIAAAPKALNANTIAATFFISFLALFLSLETQAMGSGIQ